MKEHSIKINLKKILEDRKITITKMSADIGISANSLGKIINEKSTSIHFDTIQAILDYLEIPLEELFIYSPHKSKKMNVTVSKIIIREVSESRGDFAREEDFDNYGEVEYTDVEKTIWTAEFYCTLRYNKYKFSFKSDVDVAINHINNDILNGQIFYNEEDFKEIQEKFVQEKSFIDEIKTKIKRQILEEIEQEIDPENNLSLDLVADSRII
ncbi:helix-turn-helix domain-containing protein [Enterococcus sp. AZ192]|uniref:helix-turn-helix domain-containing protein n=1 Tax=unclassified Enterococcus TaxID=2608891 RepID=UPI003D2E988B